ncbi:DUF1028 domain-containing protein [bacterium]|nr:DUF1028 domain-containing protein [candidate division CSSED10-310 bacterium]
MKKLTAGWLILLVAVPVLGAEPANHAGTFSIVAYDPMMEEWGVAVQSKFLAVGSAVPFARAGVGAVATQAMGNTAYGPEALALMALGVPVEQVIGVVTGKDAQRDFRQVGVVDGAGHVAAWTGSSCSAWAGHVTGLNFSVQGNILTGEEVIQAMAASFETSQGPLGVRLIKALQAGQGAGGDSRGRQSAALLVVRRGGGYGGNDDRFIDLRVDDNPEPIVELERLYGLHETFFQGASYVRSGREFMAAGKHAAAERAFSFAIRIAERNMTEPYLLNAVAWELALADMRLDKALRFAAAAVVLAPDNANIWDTLGEVYARQGEFKKAVAAAAKAVALEPESTEFAARLETWKKAR